MTKQRLDNSLVLKGLVSSRSQAESYIKLGLVTVDGKVIAKPGYLLTEKNAVKLTAPQKYVSRCGLKLSSVADTLGLDFAGKAVLDVGSSTGGFSDYALKQGAAKILAVDVGKNQLHESLRNHQSVESLEQTDIRSLQDLSTKIDIVLIDVSFISIREILEHLPRLITTHAVIVAMVKPQFETLDVGQKHKGVIKNNSVRREILKKFEQWVSVKYKILSKADSAVAGEKGNVERFYLLRLLANKNNRVLD